MTLTSCTFAANTATGGQGGLGTGAGKRGGTGGSADGGGVYDGGNGSYFNSIVANDTVTAGAGGIGSNGATNGPNGSAIGPDVSGPINSQGHNLISRDDGSSGWVGSDFLGTIASPLNPLLGSLADNGGPTKTMALQPASAAIDAGDDSLTNSLATDQRGHPRKAGAHVDIGAYEVNPPLALVVSNTNDSGNGSLREAIVDAAPSDSITFAAGVTGTIALTGGELQLYKNLTIQGPGANLLAVNGNAASRVFHVANYSTVSISGLTITNGNVGGANGGGLYNDHSTLTVSNCTVAGNAANYGGGIFNDGSSSGSAALHVIGSTFSGNSATNGGGIYNDGESSPGGADVTVVASTLATNSAGTAGSGIGHGGGIYNDGYSGIATATVRGCTFSGNLAGAVGGGGGIFNNGGPPGSAILTLGDTILVRGVSGVNVANSSGTFTDSGYNLSNDSVSLNGGTNDQPNVDAKIGPLQNNGGPTPTMALLSNSPAIDKGNSFGLTTDQRGAPRPFDFSSITNATGGDGSDIGAFELGQPQLNITRSPLNVILSWPAYYGDFRLESLTDLSASGSWSGMSNSVMVVGDQFNVTDGVTNADRFYRLKNF